MGERSQSKAAPVECSNCNAVIGRGATAHLHDGQPVCGQCHDLLLSGSPELTDVRGGEMIGVVPRAPGSGGAKPRTGLGPGRISIGDGFRIGIGFFLGMLLIAAAVGLLFLLIRAAAGST